jgi:hypothetical protein
MKLKRNIKMKTPVATKKSTVMFLRILGSGSILVKDELLRRKSGAL